MAFFFSKVEKIQDFRVKLRQNYDEIGNIFISMIK
jgi:hypothetical protein